ncbi:MAG: hypothetical protein ACI4EU_02865 [Butyrivibrio sp.]
METKHIKEQLRTLSADELRRELNFCQNPKIEELIQRELASRPAFPEKVRSKYRAGVATLQRVTEDLNGRSVAIYAYNITDTFRATFDDVARDFVPVV